MKSNLNKIFESMLDEFKLSNGFSIEEALDEIMPQIQFEGRATKSQMARQIIRGTLTTLLNSKDIYSYEKGKFVSLENANEEQLKHFFDKAKRDAEAADIRKAKAEEKMHQISMAWDEEGHFIGFNVPEAVEL